MNKLSTLHSKEPTTPDNPLPFTGMKAEPSVLPTAQATTSACLLHRSCKTLLLNAFIEAYTNDDYTQLIIEGQPTAEELQEAWEEILSEYYSKIKSENSDFMLDLVKRIGALQHHLFYVENAVLLLRSRYDVDVVEELIAIGYPGEYDFLSPKYQEELDMVETLATRKVFDLEELQDEYRRMNHTPGGDKHSENDFLTLIAMLSKFTGYRIDKFAVKVDEFVAIFNLYLMEINHNKKGANNG